LLEKHQQEDVVIGGIAKSPKYERIICLNGNTHEKSLLTQGLAPKAFGELALPRKDGAGSDHKKPMTNRWIFIDNFLYKDHLLGFF
jgi:hypothetical protein